MAFGRTTLKGRRYWDLREKHFTPIEARAFSKLSRKYPALRQLIATRSAQWDRFVNECERKGWKSEFKRKSVWKERVVSFYDRERRKLKRDRTSGMTSEVLRKWIVHKDVHGKILPRPRISPWEWYDSVFRKLPDELKWDTPRSHRTRQPDVQVDKIEIQRFIHDLKLSIDRTDDEKQRAQFQVQINNLKRSLRR